LDESDIEFRAGDYKQTSVISDRSIGRTDESFHNVFRMIHDPAAESVIDEERKSKSNWLVERKSKTNWLVRTK
jgi:hypothetical protein